MRDVFVTLLILVPLLFTFTRPWLGVALYAFVSVGVPQKMTWGFALQMPFAQIVALVILLAWLFSQEPKRFPLHSLTVAMLALCVSMTVSTSFALFPEGSWEKWGLIMKAMFMIFVSIAIIQEKKHIEWLIAALVCTVGFYGVKGGLWTIMTGGGQRVYGPPGGFISENNHLALALVMTIPLMHYFYVRIEHPWAKRASLLAMILCVAAVLGSHSRGALLAVSAMGLMLWWQSKQKIVLLVAIVLLIPLLLSVMPEHWWARMQTISTYQEDSSAMSRLESWETMFNIAKDRPWTGGGYRIDTKWIYQIYAPNPDARAFVAHSIYFSMMGEHGFLGLAIFLIIGWLGFRTAGRITRLTASIPEWRWANDLARMIKVSLVGFAVGGAFLNMAYFEMTYFLMVALIAMDNLVKRELPSWSSADVQLRAMESGKRRLSKDLQMLAMKNRLTQSDADVRATASNGRIQ